MTQMLIVFKNYLQQKVKMGCMFEQYDIQEFVAVLPTNTSKMFLNEN